MAVYRTYQCPECEDVFDFLHHPNDEPPPSNCPLCHADVTSKKSKPRQVDRLKNLNARPPAMKGVVSKSADSVYRGMENASRQRMQDAAEMLGVDVRTLSGMKMTDMKDNLREGDLSMASHTPSAATQITGDVIGRGNFGLNGPGAQPVATPGAPTSEMKSTMGSIFSGHSDRMRATMAAGVRK